MTNYVKSGEILTLTAPYTVASGAGALVGSIFGVATGAVASGATGEFKTTGVVTLPKATSLAISAGDLLYWDNSAKNVNKTNTNKLIGVATAAQASNDTTVNVRLNGAFIS